MKTAISIPDPLFQAAELLAEELGLSRSELYSTSQILTIDKGFLEKKLAKINAKYLRELDIGLRLVLALTIYN